MLGFGLVSGVVQVVPVGSLLLARKSTRKKRSSTTCPVDKNGIPSRVTVPSSGRTGRGWTRTASGRSITMWLKFRVGQRRDLTFLDRSHAPASSRAIAHVRSGRARRQSRDLGSHLSSGCVVLVSPWSIFSLTKENRQERLSPHHSPAQSLTYKLWEIIFRWSSSLDKRHLHVTLYMWPWEEKYKITFRT